MKIAEDVDVTSGVVGGLMIGASTTAFLYLTGKTIGISGFVGDVITGKKRANIAWSASFLLGLYTAGVISAQHGYDVAIFEGDYPQSLILSSSVILQGLLVGYGTRMGSGCTSGHGVCGLGRLSPRSLVAVCTFMFGGAVTAFAGRHFELDLAFPKMNLQYLILRGDGEGSVVGDSGKMSLIAACAPTLVTLLAIRHLCYNTLVWRASPPSSSSSSSSSSSICSSGTAPDNTVSEKVRPSFSASSTSEKAGAGTSCVASPTSSWKKEMMITLSSFFAGLTFGVGLVYGGMGNSNRVKAFLDFSAPSGWDPSLMGVMGGAVASTLTSFNLLHLSDAECALEGECNINARKFSQVLKIGPSQPSNMHFTKRLIVGSFIFGLGWGLGGICPGPAFMNLGAHSATAAVFVPSCFLGMVLQDFFPIVE